MVFLCLYHLYLFEPLTFDFWVKFYSRPPLATTGTCFYDVTLQGKTLFTSGAASKQALKSKSPWSLLDRRSLYIGWRLAINAHDVCVSIKISY